MTEPSHVERKWTGKRSALLAVGLAVLVLAAAWALWPAATTPATGGVGMTRADNGAGGVTFKATLKGLQPDTLFTVDLDTHTVDVGAYDLRNIVLRGGADNPPSAIRTIVTSQHHVEADLTFPAAATQALTLVAKDLAGVPERTLVFS